MWYFVLIVAKCTGGVITTCQIIGSGKVFLDLMQYSEAYWELMITV